MAHFGNILITVDGPAVEWPNRACITYNEGDVGMAVTIGQLKQGTLLAGVLSGQTVTVIAAMPLDGAVNLVYSKADGAIESEILDMKDLSALSVVQVNGDAPKYDADPDEFRLAAEALRISYAALYDPMSAVYTSDIDPLPHQIRAVYEDMLPKVPLRFLLADDPGAGKTVMAGLYVKEMLLRSAADRVVIVCPGGLADQWRDELLQKFNLDFEVFQPFMQDRSPSGNPFRDHDRLIVRMDQVARSDVYRQMLKEVRWDIAIVDEAHRMSAHFKNAYGETDTTKRFQLGETLATTAENLLLMTATPHSGKEEDFQLFMSLLDKDRFAGKFKPNRHRRTDTKGLMRRMVKEDLLTFEGKPLFPERHAQTVAYELSEGELKLYRDVTDYVRSGMNAAQRVMQEDSRRGNSIGFALTVLQRRLASSPEAIYRSLDRRRDKLSALRERILEDPTAFREILDSSQNTMNVGDLDDFDDLWDEADENQQGQLELDIDRIVDSTTSARTIEELDAEIGMLDDLVAEAREVRGCGHDAKWIQLSDILQEHVLDAGTAELPHKMIIFTEHRDTLEYLRRRIETLLGQPECVAVIHGGMSRDERRNIQERFVNEPQTRILVATDAAGEGLNLQRADLMVNYDLPWNPNRIEQRFGRIHRIGQKRVCYLWNLVAKNTREGEVYGKLLGKIQTMDKAYEGRLFNVLGDGKAFNGESLKTLMLQAIRYGDDPSVQARLDQVIDSGVSQGLDELLRERSAHPERYTSLDVEEVRRLMERTRERKLQPGYISAFFLPAFTRLHGTIRQREKGRWEITHVPAVVRNKAIERNRRKPLAESYERVTFIPELTHIGNGKPDATLIAPGTPLLDAVTELVTERYGAMLDCGTVFVDRTDSQPQASILMMAVEQSITNDRNETVSRHFDYMQLADHSDPGFSPAPPYLDYDAPALDECSVIDTMLQDPWLREDHTALMQQYVYRQGTKPRLEELQARIDSENEHVLTQVEGRLNAEIEYWYEQYNRLHEDERNKGAHGKNMNSGIAKRRAEAYEHRLEDRERDLSRPVRLHARPAVIRGVALVVPERLLDERLHRQASRLFARNTAEVDRRAVELTLQAERALGRAPKEMPHNNKGFDIRSTDASGRTLFIEVKGRIDRPDVDTFTVTANEVAFAQSQGDRHRLALVRISPIGPEHDRIRYVTRAFDAITPADSTRSFNERLDDYWQRGTMPC